MVSSEGSLIGNSELQNTVTNICILSIELIGIVSILETESILGMLHRLIIAKMHRVDDDIELQRTVQLIRIHTDQKRKGKNGCHSLQIGSVSQLVGKSGIVERRSNHGINDRFRF